MPSLRTTKMRLSSWCLALLGWQAQADYPASGRYVLIVAPHTSNWDFPLGLLASGALGLDAHWMGKHSLFRWPFGWLFRALGGVAVNRGQPGLLIEQMAQLFASHDPLVLALAPEGTRGATDHWKSGFYRIAVAAQVPIAMAYMDYGSRQIGLGGSFMPSGDVEADLQLISAFFAGHHGKIPHLAGQIRFKEK